MNESILYAHIKSLGSAFRSGQAVGVHSKSRWQGKNHVQVGDQNWRVVQCDSVLQMREYLIEDAMRPLVVITPLPTPAIGDDVRARLFKHQVMSIDPWTSLAERFNARQVDPALRQAVALAEAALEALGENETALAPSGILTADSVWQVVLRNRLKLTPVNLELQDAQSWRPDLLDFLPWMMTDGAKERLETLKPTLLDQLEDWLSLRLGDLGPILIQSLKDGHGGDAVAVGLALEALNHSDSDSRAMGRIERFTGNQPLTTATATRWNQAAEQWVLRNVERIRKETSRVDQILEEVGAIDSAIRSNWSPLGFEKRLAAFAQLLGQRDQTRCQEAFTLIASHEGSKHLEELRGRRDRAEMAMRLVRWLANTSKVPSQLLEAILSYEREGSWVDWARHQLLAGDEPEGVARAYIALFEATTEKREQENRRFGHLLAASTAGHLTPPDVLVVEDVLRKVVDPLVKRVNGGVLFIAMDGMSLPVWRELSVDLEKHGWSERVPIDGPSHRSALTVLPSVTSFSRASLLCGELASGSRDLEKRGFQQNPDLRSVKPVLFHKDEVGSSGTDLSADIRVAIGRDDLGLVGVVLNVVDDSLGGPDQLSIEWSLKSIPVLRTLLSEARNSGRVVVLASDHGHVLDHNSRLTRFAASADRWRNTDLTSISSDEFLIKGHRVLAEGGQIVAPISETIRYTANRRQGYHGGLTPQECIAPVAVLSSAALNVEGWEERPSSPPEWWSDPDEIVSEKPRQSAQPKQRKTGTSPTSPGLPLFPPSVERRDWIAPLLASEMFASQMDTFAGRVTRDLVEQSLRVLADRNLVLLKLAFAEKMQLSNLRIDGLISSLQRILNIEGYLVLSVDGSQTIRLNLPLLREQFELGAIDDR